MDDFLGEEIYQKYGEEFPLLFKIIDANDFLSVQVHPDDRIAREKHGLKFGKSEMWYIIDADPRAQIIAGFNQPMTKEKLQKHIENGSLETVLNFVPVQKGDVVYVPSGLVHAMCPGILVAEIQQNSDITYRLYDWNRTDETGQSRQLHIAEASDAINYDLQTGVVQKLNATSGKTIPILDTPHFIAGFINLESLLMKNLEEQDTFIVYMVISGSFILAVENGKIKVSAGECVLIPAMLQQIGFLPDPSAEIIEIIPK